MLYDYTLLLDLDPFLVLMIYWGSQENENQQKEGLDKAPDTPTGK